MSRVRFLKQVAVKMLELDFVLFSFPTRRQATPHSLDNIYREELRLCTQRAPSTELGEDMLPVTLADASEDLFATFFCGVKRLTSVGHTYGGGGIPRGLLPFVPSCLLLIGYIIK